MIILVMTSCVTKKGMTGKYLAQFGPSSSLVTINRDGTFSQRIFDDMLGDSTLNATWTKRGNTIHITPLNPSQLLDKKPSYLIEKDTVFQGCILNIHLPEIMETEFTISIYGNGWYEERVVVMHDKQQFVSVAFQDVTNIDKIAIGSLLFYLSHRVQNKEKNLFQVYLNYDDNRGEMVFPVKWKRKNNYIYPIDENDSNPKDKDKYYKQN